MKLSRSRQALAITGLYLAGMAIAIGCGSPTSEATGGAIEDGATVEPIVDIAQTWGRRQTIGNCWLYATASWAESLNKQTLPADEPMPDGAVTSVIIPGDAGDAGDAGPAPWRPSGLNISESYWTYWHWFDQLANGANRATEIETGGWYETAAEIANRYGVVKEVDFIPAEQWFEGSPTQKRALATINESMKNGVLKDPAARRDRALVRAELDRAFELPEDRIAKMDHVFGRTVGRTLDRTGGRITEGTSILRANEIPVMLRDPATKRTVTRTLQDAIGTRLPGGRRQGPLAWNQVPYPRLAQSRRQTLARMQQAMHDLQPVIVTWHVDFNAQDEFGRFLAPPEKPGKQGGHMVIVDDYQINDVPGFGTLSAGTVEERAGALAAALAPSAKIEFIRVKNSWGTGRPDATFVPGGYHDLYMKYLDGPIKRCTQNAEGQSTDDCVDDTPLDALILPPGY